MDGWSNLVTLLGTNADKRNAARIHWEVRDPEFFEQLYAGGGIPARIVDLIPEESLREWIDWIGVNKDNGEDEQIEDRCQELDVRGSLLKTWKWGRAYGGACLHIVTDTADPASPLRYGERVIGLRDLSRWDVRVLTTDIEYDFGSPNWGHPRIYYLNVQMGSQYKGYPIHWTRMIRFDGQLVPRRTYIRNNYWHDSILNRLYDTIRDYQISNDAAAACLQDFNVDVYKMKNLANLIQAGQEQVVKDRMEMLNYAKSVLNAMLLDSDDEEYENKGRSLEGVAELLIHQANRLVAETDIPHTKLLGESPDGSNATGNSTSQQWYNYISSEQNNYLKPKMKRLLKIIFPDRPELSFKFRSLRVLDDMEKADLRQKQSTTDKNYIDSGVLDPTEVAQSRFGGHEYSLETELDMDARDQGLIGANSAQSQDLFGQQPPKRLTAPPMTKPQTFSTTGNQPPEGKENQGVETGPSETEPGPMRGHEGEGRDVFGYENEIHPEPTDTPAEGQGLESVFSQRNKPGAEFDMRNEEIPPGKDAQPKTKAFISQMMSEPMRDPRTDPHLKGPGIPNKQRTILPTRGTGVTAPSGFDPELDAVKSGFAREETHADSAENEQRRAATIIVRKDDKFLMGKRRDNGRWTLPGGIVNDNESMHNGAIRELTEETGMHPKKLKFLGSRMVEPEQGKNVQVSIYEHTHNDRRGPHNRLDPDKEISEFRWLSSKDKLPEEIAGNLHHPNNVALDHMGLLK